MHEKWEQERLTNTEKTDIHYNDIKYDGKNLLLYLWNIRTLCAIVFIEARELGVGHFKFSSKEEERKKQMKYFDELKAEVS